jgi:hypothetical protein
MWNNHTPLGLAVEKNRLAAVKLLTDCCHSLECLRDLNFLVLNAVVEKHFDIFEVILPKLDKSLENETLIFGTIIAEGAPSTAWNMAVRANPAFLASQKNSDLLSHAIRHRRVDIVRQILEAQPQLAIQKDIEGKWPLASNKNLAHDKPEALEERKLIRSEMVQRILERVDPTRAREIFSESESEFLTASSSSS